MDRKDMHELIQGRTEPGPCSTWVTYQHPSWARFHSILRKKQKSYTTIWIFPRAHVLQGDVGSGMQGNFVCHALHLCHRSHQSWQAHSFPSLLSVFLFSACLIAGCDVRGKSDCQLPVIILLCNKYLDPTLWLWKQCIHNCQIMQFLLVYCPLMYSHLPTPVLLCLQHSSA